MEGKHSPKHAAPTRSSRRTERAERSARDKRPERPEPALRQEAVRDWETPPEREKMPRRRRPVWQLIIQDILLTGLVLCVFASFHHVLPRLNAKNLTPPAPTSIMASPAPRETAAPTETAAPEDTPEPTPEFIDNRTEWQKKFEDHFTDEVVITENSYTSPNVSISISTVTVEEPSTTVCYVADIYVAQIENFQTYWATGEFGYYFSEDPVGIARNAGAILSINGDYANNQQTGLLVRNGQLYMSEQTVYDLCVLYQDGSMETFAADEYKVEDILAGNPYQTWKFGPELLDDNGQPKQSFNTSDKIAWENPRSGIGYFEPGHYCFIVVDGRQNGYSRGLDMTQFAQLFTDLGCKAAYNLDGGQSSVMTFNQSIYNHPYLGGRDSGDILLIRELPEQSGEGEDGQ